MTVLDLASDQPAPVCPIHLRWRPPPSLTLTPDARPFVWQAAAGEQRQRGDGACAPVLAVACMYVADESSTAALEVLLK